MFPFSTGSLLPGVEIWSSSEVPFLEHGIVGGMGIHSNNYSWDGSVDRDVSVNILTYTINSLLKLLLISTLGL